MDREMVINNLLANYGKYGVTRAELEPIIDDGITFTKDGAMQTGIDRSRRKPG